MSKSQPAADPFELSYGIQRVSCPGPLMRSGWRLTCTTSYYLIQNKMPDGFWRTKQKILRTRHTFVLLEFQSAIGALHRRQWEDFDLPQLRRLPPTARVIQRSLRHMGGAQRGRVNDLPRR